MNIFAEIHKHVASLPEPVIDFYKVRENSSFAEKLMLLEKELSAYTSLQPTGQYFKYLFLGLCQYYLLQETYVTNLEQAKTTGLFPEFLPFIGKLIAKQKMAERVLVIVAFEGQLNTRFKKLSSINENITVIAADIPFDLEAMLKSWETYDQVFLSGHGEDKSEAYQGHIRLGDKKLTPGMITEFLSVNSSHPAVLGIFTCGEAFYAMAVKNQIDYFIADHESSVPEFVEMFLYGYLLTYFKSYNVLQAFQAGRLATIFQAKSDPTYKIFAGGIKLQE